VAISDFYSNVHLLIRWLHVFAGIIWIGHLYFFNFVNGIVQPTLDKETKKLVNPAFLGRAFWWFRLGAMTTFLAGLVLFVLTYFYTPGVGFGMSSLFLDPEGGMTGRAWWIQIGMTLGTIMWFNVWFIIWPAQKQILPWVRDGQAPPELAALAKRATHASKVNTFLSGPMLFGMLAPAHYSAYNHGTALVAILLGALAIWCAYKGAPKVGKPIWQKPA